MKRINEYKTTEAMAIDVLAKSMSGKVYNLAAGDPNLPVCEELQEAFRKTDLDNTHNYGSSQGSAGLRKKLWKNPEEVVIANGAKQLMYMSLAAVTRLGDKAVIIGPCWTSYMRIAEILGLDYVLLTGKEKDRYIPDIEEVRRAITPDTAAVVLNNPNNPTGVVYPEEYVCEILSLCVKNNCWLISDEIYRFLADKEVFSLRGKENAVVIDGFSKSLNITGWRLGYAIAPKEVAAAMTALQSQMSGPPSTLIQSILTEALDTVRYASFADYAERIKMLCRLQKFRKHCPDGGFYFYLPVAENWESSIKLCEAFLKDHHIAMTPGDSYGVPRTVRISVAAVSEQELEEILPILEKI